MSHHHHRELHRSEIPSLQERGDYGSLSEWDDEFGVQAIRPAIDDLVSQ
jgi:hypothetical protein